MRWASTSVSVCDWKSMAFLFELRAERQIIFDDAVVHKHQAPACVEMRMSVLVGHAAMSSPARMTDTEMAVRRICRDDLGQIGDASDGLSHFDASAVERGDACGIVAAIFETPQAIEQDRNCLCPADVTNNAAHRNFES